MSSPEETSGNRVINVLCKNSSLVAFKEGQEGYEQSMERVFNRSPSNKPNAFIKPRTADEVHNVLQYASTNHLQVSVLGGGHDPKGKLRSGFRVSHRARRVRGILTNQVETDFFQPNDLAHMAFPTLSGRFKFRYHIPWEQSRDKLVCFLFIYYEFQLVFGLS